MRDIPSIIKTLLSYQSPINTKINTTKIYEKYLEKIKLKNQADEAILKYTECIEQYNSLCLIERDILTEKQQKEQKMMAINQIHVFDNKVLKNYNEFNDKLQKLIEENQNWIEKEWIALEKKWKKWNSEEIAIFIGHTLECKKSKVNQFHDIVKKKKIDEIALLKMSKNDWMDVFDFDTFSQACLIYDSFIQICNKYPIDVIASEEGVPQRDIPKEYLCPLSNSIMNDPVIALNGITYDRSAIMNQYRNIPNCSSLMIDGNLKLYPDYSLRADIQNFLKKIIKQAKPAFCLDILFSFLLGHISPSIMKTSQYYKKNSNKKLNQSSQKGETKKKKNEFF
ncbi:hypothetical protein RFI_37273 [Reticulomyxa filosa]|uniref:U-box domain-containing protein n=1 Tax=Reticulomyxa filosa TaxID=46433 RepID=X6LFM1_RETFI|nr:hypothetical protein RFI_37273 [Reticulomyxa filosa]|eukprot:ETO00176.1 hypothetical protein RFI_37273 [Reticulomyxa filosa]